MSERGNKPAIEQDISDGDGAAGRALLALVHDLSEMAESFERVRIQTIALAQRHGIKIAA